MPILAIIEGVKLTVYSNDHAPPHIHALFGEYRAIINISDGKIDVGSLPPVKQKAIE